MAENKKSFLMYCDVIDAIDHLTNEEKGRLFQHLLEYVNDMNPILEDRVLLGSWKHIQLQLKRDLVKYESIKDRNRKNGALGGRPKKDGKPKKPNGLIDNPKEPKKPDTDIDTDTDIDIDIDTKTKIEQRKLKFASTLESYIDIYGRDMLNDFYEYWTEPNKSNSKFRQEMEKTWALDRRLKTWAGNVKSFKKDEGKESTNDLLKSLSQS